MNERWGRKEVHRDKRLIGREKESTMNFLPSVSILLCKSWVYTHRLPPLGRTHNMRRNLPVCACMWRVCGCRDESVSIQWWYLSVTCHAPRPEFTYCTNGIHEIYCPERSKWLWSSIQAVRWHWGFPMKWQLHWLLVTPPQHTTDQTQCIYTVSVL